MYRPNFRRKANNVPILSKEDIDYIAERMVGDFSPNLVKTPGELDIDRFITNYLGLNLEYHYLSHNGIYLGMMVFGDTNQLPVYDPAINKAKYVSISANTVIIDHSLLPEESEYRYRFTGGHEAGHSVFHTDVYGYNKDQLSFFDCEFSEPVVKCRAATVNPIDNYGKYALTTDNDWMEWQANYFASALLMPKSMVKYLVRELEQEGIGRVNNLAMFVSETFKVSLTAAAHRLTSLGIIEPYRIHIGE